MRKDNYILVTPMKDEGEFIEKTIISIVNQSVHPKIWVILNDDSIDKSPQIVKMYSKKYHWIHLENVLGNKEHTLNMHYSELCMKGFSVGLEKMQSRNINVDYICLLDADTFVSSDYYPILFEKFKSNPKLGLASGQLYNIINGKKQLANPNKNYVCGTGRIWSYICFIQTGGYVRTCSPDTVSNIRVAHFGFEAKRFSDATIYQQRATASYTGLWNGFYSLGQRQYYTHVHPLKIFLKSGRMCFKKPFYLGCAMFLGYFINYILMKPKLNDKIVIEYQKKHIFK